MEDFYQTGKNLIGGIHIPKNVAIKNVRLGLLQFVLKVAAGVWAVILMFSMRAYDNYAVPSISFLEAWQEPSNLVPTGNLSYCTNPAQHDYVFNEDYIYNMSGCEYLPFGEAYTKQGSSIFFPTSIDDVYVWTFGPGECSTSNASAEVFCNEKGGTLRSLGVAQSGAACECLIRHSFFAVHPEGRQLFFSHGFEVSNLGVLGNGRMRGNTRLENNQYTSSGGNHYGDHWQDLNDDGILTIIQDYSGKTCSLGKTSRFLPSAARQGIGGSLTEWMACAGVDLQLADEKMRSRHPLETNAPVARLTGLELQVQLEYHNVHPEVDFNGVVCYVRISAVQLWNSENSLSYGQLQDQVGRSSYRSRLQRGVEIRFGGHGRIEFLDFILLTTAISNILTIMSIPALLVGFLALYGLGPLSNIYFAAANANVHVPDDCKTAVTRLIASEAAMNSIDSKGITKHHVRDVLARLLKKYMGPEMQKRPTRLSLRRQLSLQENQGDIQKEELERLVEFVMESIHREDDDSTVDGEEYLRLHHRNDPVQLADIVDLFNEDRPQGVLEVFFQDRDAFRRHKSASEKAKLRSKEKTSDPGVSGQPLDEGGVPISSAVVLDTTFEVEAEQPTYPVSRVWRKGHCAALLAKRNQE